MDDIKLIKLNYDRENLLSICENSKLIESKHLSNNKEWQYGLLTKDQIIDLYQQIENITGSKDIEIRYIVQKANYEVAEHKDLTHRCAINIMLSTDYGPIVINEKEIYYDCALINTQKNHSVPAYKNDRKILKFGIRDIDYEEASRTASI
jgi:hypothetical protein